MSKSKFLLTLSLLFIGGLIMVAGGFRASEASEPAAIDPGLRQSIVDAGSGEYLLYLHQQADLSAANGMIDWGARGQFVYDTLLETARTSQVDLLRILKDQQVAGNVSNFQSYFIANAILVNSNVATFDLLAKHPDVARMETAPTFYIEEPKLSGAEAIEWGVQRINAPQIWADLGTTGQGAVVANIDTGVDYDHPAVTNQYRGNLGGGSFDHDFNWYDPSKICGNPSVAPCDNNNHGTHTMGTMVGDDGGSNQIGVAPGAKWIASKGCESGSCSTNALLKSFEWIIAPCPLNIEPGDASCDPNMRPNVVNNSWGSSGGNTTYLTSVQNLRAAAVFPAFSAGNSGPGAGTVGSPGDYAESFAVGATDINDVIASFSSRGPSTLTNEIKPDVSAPGVNVRSSINGGGYSNFDGTSMASPHVAGCVALLMSIDPNLSLDMAEDLMRNTAVDLGTPGPDYNYGYGRLDCYAAAAQLSPGFSMAANPTTASVCAPGSSNFSISVGQIAGYTGNVTLSATGQPGTANFSVNPVAVPGSSVMNLSSGNIAGTYNVTVNGVGAGADPKSTAVDLNVYTANPGAVTLVSPANGQMDVPLVPTFTWNAGAQNDAYLIAAKNLTSGALMYAVTNDTSYSFATPLDPLAIYAWSVRPYNPCGAGAFAQFRFFRTQAIPPILVVDDDDNAPNVQSTYTGALDALGLGYDIWDTNNSDNEPDAATLQQYDVVIWFTGDEFGGSAGPGSAGESALGTYLDANGCLFISSQDYVYDRGVTGFMQSHLGLASAISDVSQTTVTGAGTVYGGLGPYTLAYPFTNYSDRLTPAAGAETAFTGNQGSAAIVSGTHKAVFFGYPYEALPAAGRGPVLTTTLSWCNQ